MAKNYTLTEAIIIAHENGDMEALADLGRRYPLLMAKVMRLVTKAGEEAVDLAQYFPAYLSANKMNKAIKEGNVSTGSEDEDADDADLEDDDDAEEETPKKKAPAPKAKPAKGKKDADDADDSDYNSMSSRELWQLLGKLNARKACEEEFGDLKKGSMVKYLEKYGENAPAADDADDDADETEESGDDYEGKSAMELFKLCKSRKIKAEPKKPAKYYIGLLKKADEAEAEDAEDDEEWDDDEEEDAAPAKKPAKSEKKPAKTEKPAPKSKKKADEDDDDDEWEI